MEGEKPKPTPLVLALAADPEIQMRIMRSAIIRTGSAVEGQDAAQTAFELVLEREQLECCWNPKGPWSAHKYMYRALRGVLSTRRRARQGDPEDPTEDMEPVARGLHPEEASDELDERMALEAIADETEKMLAEDSQGAIPLAMLEASTEQDYEDHADLADRIGCSVK